MAARKRKCECCGETYAPTRSDSRFCKPACRAKAHRRVEQAAKIVSLTPPAEPGGAGAPQVGSTAAATIAHLEALGRLEHPLGIAAVQLARRLDAYHGDTASSLASAAGRLALLLDKLEVGAAAKADPIDEVKRKRQERLRGA